MEFALILLGVLVGQLWTWLFGSLPQTASITRRAPAPQLGASIAIAGVAIGLVELHVFSSGRLASGVSKGLIAGLVWLSWSVSSARLLHAPRQVVRALAYLSIAPALVLAAVLGGYLSLHLDYSLS